MSMTIETPVTIVQDALYDPPGLIVEQPAESGDTAQAIIGFKAWNGTALEVHGWVGYTGHTYSFGPFPDATYLENDGAGGVVLLADDPTHGRIRFFAGGYTSTAFERMAISPVGNVGIGLHGADAQFPLDVHADTNQIHAQTALSTGQAAIYVENDRGAFKSYGGLVYGGSAEALPIFSMNRADRLFLIADGDNNQGLAIGTLRAQPVIFGTDNIERMRIDGSQGIPVYANNAAALAGGLAVGSLYRTGADPDPLCIVH
jgi:hypothetical protein